MADEIGVSCLEIEKMKAVQEQSHAIGEFLDNCGYALCKLESHGRTFGGTEYVVTHKSIEEILADYFHIDLKKVEAEKRQLLESVRAAKAAKEKVT